MPDTTEDTNIPSIEPTARQIAGLSKGAATTEGTDIRFIQPFSGLLQRGRPAQSGQPGPNLTYLTLQSLVIQHIREKQTQETVVEATEDTHEPDDTSTETKTESLTVRELLQQSSRDDASEGDSTANADPDDGQQASGNDSTHTVVREETPEGGRPASDDTDSTTRQTPSFDTVSELDGVSDGTLSRDDSGPLTTLDAAGSPETDERTRRSGTEPESQPTPQRPGADRSGPTVPQSDDLDLVVARGPLAGKTGSDADDDSKRPSQSGQPTRQGRGESHSRRDAPQSSAARHKNVSSTSSVDPSPSQQPRDDDSGPSLPLSLESVDQPALDRFVEQLSEKLARHERVERERRGL